MRKSESNIADRHYLMDIPAGALVVAPDTFFTRFGKTFSVPNKVTLADDLKKNQVYHAVPSDKKREKITPFVVRRIHNSRIKDALAGKMVKEILSPKDHIEGLLKDNDANEAANEAAKKAPEVVNIFAMPLPQLRLYAETKGIKDFAKLPRLQLTKALQALEKKDMEK
jgi:hypothetical protein